MEVNRLSQYELAYEMEWRGLSVGTVEEMRKALRVANKLARRDSFVAPAYKFSFEEDQLAIEKKLVELGKLLENPPKSETSKEYLKILTKVEWGLRRLDRSVPENEEQEKIKLGLRNKLITEMTKLETDEDSDEDLENDTDEDDTNKNRKLGVANQRSVEHQTDPQTSSSSRANTSNFDQNSNSRTNTNTNRSNVENQNLNHQVVYYQQDRFEQIHKWEVKFTGERCGASVNAFLERVEEKRLSRGVSEAQLFRSAVDLFVGKALIWFRAIRVSLNSWAELVSELKLEFLPPNYDDMLLEEIRRRTQGQNESIGVYVATMQNLFSRLSDPISERRKLGLIQRNLSPFYQTQLGLARPNCVSDLVALGRDLEAVRANVESYVPPPNNRNRNLLEPDLAYVGIDQPVVSGQRNQIAEQSNSVNVFDNRNENESRVNTQRINGNRVNLIGNERNENRTNGNALNRNRVIQNNSGVRCYNCNGVGHFANRCSAVRRCYGCGRVGVTRSNCQQCASGNGNRALEPAGREVRRR